MKKNTTHFKIFCLLFLAAFSAQGSSLVHNPQNGDGIEEEKFVTIGGIEQWITIKGHDKNNPVILYIHGGPGSPMSPYADTIFHDWKKDFTIVNWDQRGSGKTYGKNTPDKLDADFLKSNPLRLEQMIEDGVEVAGYLIDYLDQEKIILMGESWGSILAVKMLGENSELFRCYIGNSQIVNPSEDLKFAYQKIKEIATRENDQESLKQLTEIGKPPYDNGMTAGRLFRIIKKYERKYSSPVPQNWWNPSPDYDNKTDAKNRFEGDDYSFFSFIGDQNLGIVGMSKKINLWESSTHLKAPVHIFQGEHDILSPFEISKAYFDALQQPLKTYSFVKGAGHGTHPNILAEQYKFLMENYKN
ncbi:alpha/beta hydrolase [Galbibacter sp. EGI 63066]|uniref:alpha/beta hydrolase family protein n=1 Tax=Galbibacter sp. EGI 63066 TaxID=2993559 RepID=UPI0022495284|nr:alpha/beta hydrolase [Galbibacter sp. EGI 63066]MCX2682078.1 alpha/beta hydrolase [Galbibacter sp. EGI 63066]